jgi:hypothetical protein
MHLSRCILFSPVPNRSSSHCLHTERVWNSPYLLNICTLYLHLQLLSLIRLSTNYPIPQGAHSGTSSGTSLGSSGNEAKGDQPTQWSVLNGLPMLETATSLQPSRPRTVLNHKNEIGCLQHGMAPWTWCDDGYEWTHTNLKSVRCRLSSSAQSGR